MGMAPGARPVLKSPMLLVAVAGVGVLAGLIGLALATGVTIEGAVSDPHEVTRLRFLGIVSNVGVLFWTAALSVCLLGARLAGPVGEQRELRRFFLASAAMTLVLLIDDLLLVHEVGDDVVALFVDFDRTRSRKDVIEAAVFAGYALMFAAYAVRFRDTLMAAAGRRFLVGSLALFAVSVIIDFGLVEAVGIDLPDYRDRIDVKSLLEEGAKFVGILFYAAFFFGLVDERFGRGASQPQRGSLVRGSERSP